MAKSPKPTRKGYRYKSIVQGRTVISDQPPSGTDAKVPVEEIYLDEMIPTTPRCRVPSVGIGGACDCEFTPDPDDPDENTPETAWHYRRICPACNGVWWSLHCPHDIVQNPCPHCGARSWIKADL